MGRMGASTGGERARVAVVSRLCCCGGGARASVATGRVLEGGGGHGVRCRGRGLSALAASVVVPRAARGGPGEQETEVEKNPLDYPAEWSVPPPSKRPDIWPEFEPMETPLPNPMPGDPEQPNEAEEEETKPDPEVDPDDPMNPEPEEEEEEEEGDGKKESIPEE
ncbi:hypothetical protein HOP50_10g60980 [Chloropicon primus]|uniref:Uncharacterized protein n=1 Tax=Chloropicon primus TaxID=1764295 RepID=A0A5B8MSF4_9CHLO|nr:hypothetical protein A3770_10p60770 [Chloropicon primus]UPR02771.1 hypothetical protein HOP50_10g60980 [Chloropicon primus]|eukprot:QDZ23559.1 hypothetical protein A3770_10p60770 [Chloropicon primus]